jgi:hypothetical protein
MLPHIFVEHSFAHASRSIIVAAFQASRIHSVVTWSKIGWIG